MSGQLSGQVAIVTGGSRGIGRAVAFRLASLGAHVVVNFAANSGAAEETVVGCQKLGGSGEVAGFDVADSKAVTAAIEGVKERHGRIDILVNNAGIARDGLILRMKDEEWAATIATNLSGALYCTRAVSKIMMKARYGRIVNMSSVVAEMGNAGQSAYAASKAGLIGMSKSLARELASRGITVNVVTPGFIDTDMTASLDDMHKEELLKAIPLGRFADASEVAHLVAFLCDGNAGYITGQVIGINGGMYM